MADTKAKETEGALSHHGLCTKAVMVGSVRSRRETSLAH